MKTVRHEAEKDLEFWTKRVKEPGYVYVIQGDPDTPVKIGYAKNPLTRLAELQTGNPQELRLRAVVPAGKDFEKHLHKRAGRAHLRGEWFTGAYGHHMLVVVKALGEAMMQHCLSTGAVPNPYETLAETQYGDRKHRFRRDLWPKISSLWLDGYSQREIGEKCGLEPSEIRYVFKVMRSHGGYELAKGAQRVRGDEFGSTVEPISFRRGNNAARRR